MSWHLVTLFLLAFLGARAAAAADLVEYRLSKVHALVNFAETAIGEPHRSEALKEYFGKSSMNNPQVRGILERFKAAHSELGEGFSFGGLPASRQHGSSGQSLLLIQSVYSKDLADLGERTQGIMSGAAHGRLLAALRELLPHYDKVIWGPSLVKLKGQQKKLEALSGKAKLDQLFTKVTKFYDSSWPNDMGFTVSLYPIPGKKGHTSAESLGAVESVGVLTEGTDSVGTLGVVFHELCHSVYEAQDVVVQAQQEKWFLESGHPFAALAYRTINEALATALGGGLVPDLVTGKLDDSSWYNNVYIEGLARGIYPEVKSYINSGRSIDGAFVEKAISIFQKKFPHAHLEYGNLWSHIVVMADWERLERSKVREAMSREFRISSRSVYGAVDDPTGLEDLARSTHTAVLLSSVDSGSRLEAVATVLPQAKQLIRTAIEAGSPSVTWGKLSSSRSILILIVKNTQEAEALLGRMKRAGRVDPASPVQKLPD